jgi:HTH-type transcriptional regulator/antitoxin HigA
MSTYRVISKKGAEIEAYVLLHPGEVLAEELTAREIAQKEFAELIDMRPPHLNELLKGKRHISAILALKLEKLLGISAGFWMRLQIEYDLNIARKQLKVA